MSRPLLLAISVLLGACGSATPPPAAFVPGVEGRGPDEVCQSSSPECQRWTELAKKCAENERKRNEGFMGNLPAYCSRMEEYREQVTGVPLSSSPGAYQF